MIRHSTQLVSTEGTGAMEIIDLEAALKLKGTIVQLRMESLMVSVRITDAKWSWGKVRLQVQPVSGSGSQWVEPQRLMK